MAKRQSHNIFSKLSNSFATGGGGVRFEQKVQATFLLSLLIEGFSPVLDAPVIKLKFQAKALGYETDDLLVIAKRSEREIKMLCQIKHKLSFTYKDKETQKVINAAWKDFKSAKFNKDCDKLAIITGLISNTSIEAFRYIHQAAVMSVSANEFLERVRVTTVTSNTTRKKFDDIVKIINRANDTVSDTDLWEFFKSLVLLVYDLDYKESVNDVLIKSLIKSNTNFDPQSLWSQLFDYASLCDQSAATVTLENFDEDILEKFGIMHQNANADFEFNPDKFLSCIALIGSWDETNSSDCSIVERIVGDTYNNIQSKLQDLVSHNAQFIKIANGIWSISHREKLISACSKFYFDQSLEHIFSEIYLLLNQYDKRLDTPYILLDTRKAFENSRQLRKSLFVGICIMLNKTSLEHCSKSKIEMCKYQLTETLFKDCTWNKLASVGELLSLVAEIAPDEYLNGLEKFIKEKPNEIKNLLPKKDETFMGRNLLCPILWSLEILAWDDKYLLSCIRCLCELGTYEFDYGNLGNNPSASVKHILKPWYPQTQASTDKKKAAIALILKDYLESEWKTIISLLPYGSSMASGTAKPKYLIRIAEEKSNSSSDQWEMFDFIFEQAVSHTKTDIQKLADLIEFVEYFDDRIKGCLFDSIETNFNLCNAEEQFLIWSKLGELKYKIIKCNNNALDSDTYIQLCKLVDTCEPSNIVYKTRRLFLSQYDEFSIMSIPEDSSKWELKTNAQREGIKQVWSSNGLTGILSLIDNVKGKDRILRLLGSVITINELSQILTACDHNEDLWDICKTIINGYVYYNDSNLLISIDWTAYTLDFIVEILTSIKLSKGVLDVVNKYLAEKEYLYWDRATIPTYYDSHSDFDVSQVIDSLNQRKRYSAIINMIGNSIENIEIEDEFIYGLLKNAAITESNNDRLDQFACQQLIEYLQNKGECNLEELSYIEYCYLPWLGECNSVKPKALETRLSMEPEFFCELISMMYKKRNETSKFTLPESVSTRLFQIFFKYRVVPGTDWNGEFHKEAFENWISATIKWAKDNDRDIVVQHTIGNGLSYAISKMGEIDNSILDVLDNRAYDAIRQGFSIGIHNQRGVHSVDPSGEEEKQLSKKYEKMAADYEKRGYSRFAKTLHEIAQSYLDEIQNNWREEIETDD